MACRWDTNTNVWGLVGGPGGMVLRTGSRRTPPHPLRPPAQLPLRLSQTMGLRKAVTKKSVMALAWHTGGLTLGAQAGWLGQQGHGRCS